MRDGHAAILTDLEELLGVRASCEELITRALDRDQDHAAWGRAAIVLSHRREQETWTAAETLRADADPSRRLFGAELMRLIELFADSHEEEFCLLAVKALTDWSAEETDNAVLAEVLHGLGSYAGRVPKRPSWRTSPTTTPASGERWPPVSARAGSPRTCPTKLVRHS